jgi:hypothetical protein
MARTFRKSWGRSTTENVMPGGSQQSNPIVLRNSTETYSINKPNQPNQPSIGESYNKMIGQYEPDISKYTGMLPSTSQFTEKPSSNGFYGSMSGLEGASMRLANAASQRSMAEAGYGSGLKRGETANEYGLRDISTAKEYGLKGGLLGQEYGLRDESTAKEYGLKGMQTAQSGGYGSPMEMQEDLKKQREYQNAYQKALASGKKGTFSGSWGSFKI